MNRDALEQLLLSASLGSLGDDDRLRLNAALREDPSARAFAARFLATDALLGDALATRSAEHQFVKANRRAPRMAWISAAAAAVVMLATIVLSPLVRTAPVVAVMEGEELRVGRVLTFAGEETKIRFQSDALLAVEGPAKLEILGDNAARLYYGVATVRVPGPTKGFELDTPAKKVIDLGTAFGVTVEQEGQTAVTVFEGEIEVADRDTPQRVFAGHAVQMNRERGKPSEEILYNTAPFQRTWESSFGLEVLKGDVRFARPEERRSPGAVFDRDALLLIPEREGIELPAASLVNIMDPGSHFLPYYSEAEVKSKGKGWKGQPAPLKGIAQPTRVDSYLLQYNPGLPSPTSKDKPFVTEVRFDREVIGIIAQKDLLAETDSLLALEGADFSGQRSRGVAHNDEIFLSPDRRTVRVAFDVSDGVDQIRVLVASHLRNRVK